MEKKTMFERKKYKNFAKKQLSGRWGVPILVTLFVFVVSSIFSIGQPLPNLRIKVPYGKS